MSRLTLAFVAVALLMAGGRGDADEPNRDYTILDDAATQLRDDFNRASGSVRALFVVDPICPGCLRGLDDMNKSLLSKTDDPRLQTFVVHVPVLSPPPTAKDVPAAAAVVQNDHAHHYWNPSGEFGRLLSNALGLEHDGEPVYAWDVWLIYGPDAKWDGVDPPKPQLLMHQLRALQGTSFPRLDSRTFARRAHDLLAQLPPPATTP